MEEGNPKESSKKSSNKKVIVYSTPTCPYCHLVKDFLNENNVAFDDIDVSQDQEAAERMVQKSGQMGVPVVEIGDEVVVGFDKDKIKELLGL